MGAYYNRTGSSVAVTLKDGSVVSLIPKRWTEIPPEAEGSGKLVRLVKGGQVVRRNDAEDVPVPATVRVKVPAPPAPVPASAWSPPQRKRPEPPSAFGAGEVLVVDSTGAKSEK